MSMEPSEEQVIQAVYKRAAALVKAGKSKEEVKMDLKSQGLDEESANVVTNNIFNLRQEAINEAGKKNMLYGALWCSGGIAVTALTYQAAAPGGTYIVAWGAIVYGAIRFFRGLTQRYPND